MNKTSINIALPAAAITALIIMVVWMAGSFDEKITPDTNQPATINTSDAIAVTQVERIAFEPVPATIQAKQATIISSRILSRIEKVHVRAGDMVSKDQILLELEKNDLQSRVSQSESRIKAIKARLIEAQQALKRASELSEKGVVAKADLEKSQANHDALIAELASSQQALYEARTTLNFAQVRSPIDGRVVDRFAEPGDTVQPGVQLLSLYNPLSLRVEANVREKLALSLQLDQSLEVDIPAINKNLTATIEERVPAGNPGSRSFLVKSRLGYTEGLLPGMYARLKIPAGSDHLLLIPADRVAKVGQLDVVWVVNNETLERRLIRTGKSFENGMTEVVSGLVKGERLMPVPPSSRRP